METTKYRKRKVYDGMLRLIHAWNAIAIVLLLLTVAVSELFEHGPLEKSLWQAHIYIGYGLVIGVTARLVWGLVGPASARFSDMWHPRSWWNALRALQIRPWERYGHHELASAVYLAVYGLLIVMAGTGLALAAIEQGMGPLSSRLFDSVWLKGLFGESHEAIAWLIGGFIAIHLAALAYHRYVEKIPVAQSMVTGYQYRIIQR